jgi:glycerophosphoryl diester phosphodiesterase
MSVYDYIREASSYSHGIGIEDILLWDSNNKKPNYELIQKIKDLKMLTHVWTFKDDSLIFDAKTNIVFVMLFRKLIE